MNDIEMILMFALGIGFGYFIRLAMEISYLNKLANEIKEMEEEHKLIIKNMNKLAEQMKEHRIL